MPSKKPAQQKVDSALLEGEGFTNSKAAAKAKAKKPAKKLTAAEREAKKKLAAVRKAAREELHRNQPDELGRPTDYKKVYDEQARKLCLIGYTDEDLADFFNTSTQTINNWKHLFPSFLDSILSGKEIADGNVGEKLYERAMGYSHEDVDIRVIEGEIVKTPIVKHYPPDSHSLRFWMTNRQRSRWAEKIVHASDPDNPLVTQLVIASEELLNKIRK